MLVSDQPGCWGAAARLPKKPGIQKLTPPSSNGGWLFGGGLEYGFKPNMTVKLEYDYLNLGDWTTSTVPAVSWRRDTQMIKLGMNYKFQPGAADGDATRTPADAAAKGQDAEELAKRSQNPFASEV